MLDKKELEASAKNWMQSWNEKDLERIMSHYADDVVFFSPTVVKRWNKPDGQLKGKENLMSHFKRGMEEVPNMRFEFHSILYSENAVILLYRRENGILSGDMVRFNDKGQVKEVSCFYADI